MDIQAENKIIDAVKANIAKYNVCSIKQVAESCFYPNLSLSDQKRLAKKMVKEFPCLTEIKNGEVLVRPNNYMNDPNQRASTDLNWVKALISVLAAAFGYILFKIILPRL